MTSEQRVIHPRLPRELHDRVQRFADQSFRSLNAAVIVLLTEALDAREAMGTGPTAEPYAARTAPTPENWKRCGTE